MANKKIGIIGLGLIGGSLALALGDKYEITGYDSDPATCEYALNNNFCTITKPENMSDCDVVFVCVPVSCMASTLAMLSNTLGASTIITDVASVKAPFAAATPRYVGGHPMAGTERGGIRAAKSNLFANAYYCLTDKGKDAEIVREIVESAGAITLFMSADAHDRAVSAFSHTPHAVAYALVSAALKGGASPIAGSGFMDTTRIAQSDESFWTEVFSLNAGNVSHGIKSVIKELEDIDALISGGNKGALSDYIRAARHGREALNRTHMGGEALFVELEDKVGEFERITGAIARAGINISNIALVPDGDGAKLRLDFGSAADKLAAKNVLEVQSKKAE